MYDVDNIGGKTLREGRRREVSQTINLKNSAFYYKLLNAVFKVP